MKDKVVKVLEELGIPYRWVDHPAVFTVAESMRHIEGKRPIKNLLLQEKNHGRKVLVIMDGERQLDTKWLAQKLGCRKLGFAKPEVLQETLGVTPGSVSVFGLLYEGSAGVEVVVDEALLQEPELGFHPNDNTATLFIPGATLGRIIGYTGHKCTVAPMPGKI